MRRPACGEVFHFYSVLNTCAFFSFDVMKTQALRLTRLAAAAAFAAAFSVQAADFSVYGIVDTGIIVEHNKMGSQPSSTSARE